MRKSLLKTQCNGTRPGSVKIVLENDHINNNNEVCTTIK